MPEPIRKTIWEGTTTTCRARHKLRSGEWLTVADIATAVWTLIDQAAPSTTITQQAVVPSETIYDTLQTGAEWTEDSTGYNVAFTIPGSYLARGGATYKVSLVLEVFALDENELPYEEEPIVFLISTRPR